jgi:predicted RecB family nuclease
MPLLTERIFNSSFDCRTKCYLLSHGRRGKKTEYETHADESDGIYRRAAIVRLQELTQDQVPLHLQSLTSAALRSNSRLVIINRAEANEWRSDAIVLFRPKSRNSSLQPVLFQRYDEVSARDKLLLAFRAALVGNATGVMPTHGQIIYGHKCTCTSIFLPPLVSKVNVVARQITHLANQKSPPLFLCAHCAICEFHAKCAMRAAEEDNISRLEGISRTQIEEQHSKGIFTLHQYSHTFRSRKPQKRVKTLSTPRYFALQARALRDNKVYIHGKPQLPLAPASAYLDIESIPGRKLHYLFGMLTVTDGVESYYPFWVEDASDEVAVFITFCQFVAALSDTTLVFHYGNYEAKVLKAMARRLGDEHVVLVDRALASCRNVLSVIHRHCYFPTYSNSLKDVASFLGYRFDNPIGSGLRSIMFRERWERTADDELKGALIRYNRQDCEALRTICAFVSKSAVLATERSTFSGNNEEVVSTDSLRKVGEGNRPIFRKAEFSCPEFEVVNKCAYFDYQRDRVFARTRRVPRNLNGHRAPKTERRLSLATTVSQTCKRCTACGSRNIICEKKFVRWIIDLKYYKTKIGVKKWQPRYLFLHYRCQKCRELLICPNVPFVASSRAIYGHGLMCWCVYHNIVGKQSMLSVHRGLRDIFNLNIHCQNMYRFRSTLSKHYGGLRDEILATILKSNVVHIDETPVKLRKTTGYVWVVSSATEVCYIFRDTREGGFLQGLLGAYDGVLVSDFFTAYDSLNCPQQKCLIHLMRDLNDDLRKDPYNQEMRSIAEPFGRLLKEIVLAIDRYGLRRRHLHKYARPAEKLCSTIAERQFTSANAAKYQNRFDKYRDKIFAFLQYDGVPWNNNNAEHAIHHFAKIRRFTDGTFTRDSLQQLLVLLTVIQTCEYRRVNPLRFLLSGDHQLRGMRDSDCDRKGDGASQRVVSGNVKDPGGSP